MSAADTYRGGFACPGCAAMPDAEAIVHSAAPSRVATIRLSLPGIHCAGCISAVERGLQALDAVRSARVNLTLKRVAIEAAPGFTAEDAVAALAGIGYEAHELDGDTLAATEADPAGRDLLMRLAVAGFAQMNVMLLSVAVWSGAEDATRDLFHWISAAIAVPAVVFAGRPFYVSALSALKARRLNMDVPISLAIILAVGVSIWETALSGRHAYFDAALSLTFFLLAGRYLDYRTRSAARSAARELAALEVPRAVRLRDGIEETVRTADLAAGDLVRVRPGGRIPVDGAIAEGSSELDRAAMTGETLPAFAGPGDAVLAGEINLTGPLTVRVEATGADTTLSRIASLVSMAESGRANYSALADRAARAYAPLVHLLALGAFLAWIWISGDLRLSLNIAVAVLIITCPCALGLAVPAVTTAASGRLFRKGFLIKSGTALERLAEVDTVVYDKTGTLTLGTPEPVALDDADPEDLPVALALAGASSHPLATALKVALETRGVAPAPVARTREVPGYGVEADIDGETVRLGRAGWVGAEAGVETATWLSRPGRPPVAFAFTDRVRPGAAAVIAVFGGLGLRQVLLSGDAAAPVAGFAERIGLSEFRAGMTPEEKAAFVQRLASEGRKVLMVGDGLNDTAALAAAHVSISPATAVDAARVASDIVLLGEGFAALPEVLGTARSATKRIRENFVISAIYNVVAVPVALLGFATPLMAALAMSASSISVTLNAMRVR